MLEIHEKQNNNGYEEIINCISNADANNIHIVESFNNNKVNGYSIYCKDEQETIIFEFYGEDINTCDGLIRAILFKSSLIGIKKCSFKIKDDDKNKTLEQLGFISGECHTIEDIDNFMSSCKKCKILR